MIERVPNDARFICTTLAAHHKRAWIVGGCVRDALLGREVADWDIATDARPEEIVRIFPRTIPTGMKHGTITVLVHGKPFEVTTLRGEGAYSDGRRPDSVEFVNDITADLARRDFTVNAIALDPTTGALIDPFGGQKDLDSKILRAVGDPNERFREDGLRILRAARFVATLELAIDPATENAIEPNLATFKKVSAERVHDEWVKTMKARAPSRAFEVMRKGGVLRVTCPELLEGVEMEQNKWHNYTVWKHSLECLDACVGDPILRIAALFHDVGKPRTRAWSDKTNDWTFYDHDVVGAEIVQPILVRMKFSNDDRMRIQRLVRHHLFHYQDDWSDAAVRRWMKRVGTDLIDDLYSLNEADVRAKGREGPPDLAPLAGLKAHVAKVLAMGAALSTKDLGVNGRDLIAMGLVPGPIIGEILATLLEEVLADPALNEREKLLSRARELADKKPT